MAFFTYDQNNSGGSFYADRKRGIAGMVIIQADTAEQADERAQAAGVYFDDDYEIDCDCCGPRWSRAYGDGDILPTVYGDEREAGDAPRNRWTSPEGYIHFADGRVEAFGVAE